MEEIERAELMSWRGVGLGGTWPDWDREVSHGSGKRVALQAWWISGGIEELGEEMGGWLWWREAEVREKKRTRERRERKKRVGIEMRSKVNGFDKRKKVKVLLGFLLWMVIVSAFI